MTAFERAVEDLMRASGRAWQAGGEPSDGERAPFRRQVRAVLEAIREPDEDLTEALQACLDCVPINRCEEQSLKVWQGGLDALLAQSKEQG